MASVFRDTMEKFFRCLILLYLILLCCCLILVVTHQVYRETQRSILIVKVRRDISPGLPYESVHSVGLSNIVWGVAPPHATLVLTLTRQSTIIVTRTVVADQEGHFAVSMDRWIEDGDTVQVSDGVIQKTVQVPILDFRANPMTGVIEGTGPPGLSGWGRPSLELIFGYRVYRIKTDEQGKFVVTLPDLPFVAGLLGTFRYVLPQGDQVYKPVFIADPLARGKPGDGWADIILGQPDFSQITPNEVVASHLFNPGGIYVDRSIVPNRVYVYDAGNNRILAFSHLGVCQGGTRQGEPCTSHSDCPLSRCQIQEERPADLVLGQPSFHTSTCNGDSGYQSYPDVPMAGPDTLCALPEYAVSISEAGSFVTMATDQEGNLYVPDFFNNRVLRYDNPFATDTVADYVWGQADFHGITCNRGRGPRYTDARSLCLAPAPGWGDLFAGVAIDQHGNLWVADQQNNRVLRFPFIPEIGRPAPEADLVLGQPDFISTREGTDRSQMHRPGSVRVDDQGIVYVADTQNRRILVFKPPLQNGMPASEVWGEGTLYPTGIELDPRGGLWVNDGESKRLVYFVDGVTEESAVPGGEQRAWGGIGVDRDSNLLATGWDLQEGIYLSAPTYKPDERFLRAQAPGLFNRTGPQGLDMGFGLEVTDEQLICSDQSRILFWNHPWNLTNYQPADGVVGAPDTHSRERWGPYFGRMRADPRTQTLWVLYGDLTSASIVLGYHLPLTTGATPLYTLTSPLPLVGGGEFSWSQSLLLSGIALQPECDCLWLADAEYHRVFRVRDVTTRPVVDMVIGQMDEQGKECNQGRGENAPSRYSLCYPGGLAFDPLGNLFVSDHNLEARGNHRLLVFDADTLRRFSVVPLFGIPASQVLGSKGDFTHPGCRPYEENPICAPFEPAFDHRGYMAVGFNAYLGPRFPLVYQDPLTRPWPVAVLADFHSMPTGMRFDQWGNLYVLDHNRSRILIYWRAEELLGQNRRSP